MLLIGMVLVPAVSAQKENSITSDKPSELEQGLIDALNSNTKGLSKDVMIANYCKANKDKISIPKNDTVPGKDNLRTYQLKDGSAITFTNKSFFYISGLKEDANNEIVAKNINTAAGDSYTGMLTAYKKFYSYPFGSLLFTINAKGYYKYNGATVTAYYYDSWYTRGVAQIWQVSNWEEGGYNYDTHTLSEIYGRGNFHWGIEYQGVGWVIEDYLCTVKSQCDKNGNYQFLYSIH